MGAQTTLMQRYFLPHPLDTILSQPFGMSEDLVTMAIAEASSAPSLASVSLTLLICGFNLARFGLFSQCQDYKALITAAINFLAGVSFAIFLSLGSADKGLVVVALQLMVQMLVSPVVSRVLKPMLKPASLPVSSSL